MQWTGKRSHRSQGLSQDWNLSLLYHVAHSWIFSSQLDLFPKQARSSPTSRLLLPPGNSAPFSMWNAIFEFTFCLCWLTCPQLWYVSALFLLLWTHSLLIPFLFLSIPSCSVAPLTWWCLYYAVRAINGSLALHIGCPRLQWNCVLSEQHPGRFFFSPPWCLVVVHEEGGGPAHSCLTNEFILMLS